MKAYRLLADGPRIVDVPTPEPGNGEVLLKIAGAGACHSDLHVAAGMAAGKSPWAPPFTLGHENTGWIAAIGPGVKGVREGEPYAVYAAWACGRCAACAVSAENYCLNQRDMRGCGLGADGGMAEYMLVPATRYLVPLGDLEPRDAAPLSDAGLTPYHAIKRSLLLLAPDASAVVIGVGGLGHMAVQILRAMTSVRIIAVDISPERLALARSLGADDVVVSNEDTLAATRELLGGQADVVLDFAGAQATVDLARKLVRPNGDCTIVGLGGGTLPVSQGKVSWGARVSMPLYGSIAELREVIALARRGRIHAHVTRFPLERAHEAYAHMAAGGFEGRAVILPNG